MPTELEHFRFVFAAANTGRHDAAQSQFFGLSSIHPADTLGEQAAWLYPVGDEDYTREPDVRA